jgi:hypothetical protein
MKKLIILFGILSLSCVAGCETTGSGTQQGNVDEPQGC